MVQFTCLGLTACFGGLAALGRVSDMMQPSSQFKQLLGPAAAFWCAAAVCPTADPCMPLRYCSMRHRMIWFPCILLSRRVAIVVRVLWSFVWFPAKSAVADAADATGGNGNAAASSGEDSGAGVATSQRRRRVRRET
jgi:hypothetical protein